MSTITVAAAPAWMSDPRRVCASPNVNPEWWFPSPGDSTTSERAKFFCRRCPLRIPCRDWAIDHREQHGIWGGTTYKQRQRLWVAQGGSA